MSASAISDGQIRTTYHNGATSTHASALGLALESRMSSEETWQAKVCMDSIQGKIQRVRALHNHNGANRSPVTEAQDALAEQSPVKLMPERIEIEQGIDEDDSHNQQEVMKNTSS